MTMNLMARIPSVVTINHIIPYMTAIDAFQVSCVSREYLQLYGSDIRRWSSWIISARDRCTKNNLRTPTGLQCILHDDLSLPTIDHIIHATATISSTSSSSSSMMSSESSSDIKAIVAYGVATIRRLYRHRYHWYQLNHMDQLAERRRRDLSPLVLGSSLAASSIIPLPKDDIKVVVCGYGGVGKSALTIRLVTDNFIHEYDPTIEDSYRKLMVVCPTSSTDITHGDAHARALPVLLDILDTAGPEEFSSMMEQWMRQSEVMIFAFSLVDKQSWIDIEAKRLVWERVHRLATVKPPCVLVGTKCDLLPQVDGNGSSSGSGAIQCVSNEVIDAYARQHNMVYVTCSALTGINVDRVFATCVRAHWARHGHGHGDAQKKNKATKKCIVQ